MNEIETTKHRLEILKMARELANEEYINKRAEDHNDWLAKVDVAWKTRGIRLPYPPFVPYPTEADIVSRALTLYKFVTPTEPPASDKNTVQTPPEISPAVPPINTPELATPVAPPETPTAEPVVEPSIAKRALSWDTFVDHTVAVEDIIVDTPRDVPFSTTDTSSVVDSNAAPLEDSTSETSIFPAATDSVEEQLDPSIKSTNKQGLTGIKNLLALGWLKNTNGKGT